MKYVLRIVMHFEHQNKRKNSHTYAPVALEIEYRTGDRQIVDYLPPTLHFSD